MGTADRKARERKAKMEAILDAAERVFIRKGFKNSTMDEIAEEAEYSKGTLYFYFKSKEALFYALSERPLNELLGYMDTADAEAPTGMEKLNVFKEAYYNQFRNNPEQFKLLLDINQHIPMEEQLESPEIADIIENKEAKLMEYLINAVKLGQTDGSMGKISDPAMHVMACSVMLTGLYLFVAENKQFLEKYYHVEPFKLIEYAHKILFNPDYTDSV